MHTRARNSCLDPGIWIHEYAYLFGYLDTRVCIPSSPVDSSVVRGFLTRIRVGFGRRNSYLCTGE
eukprot:3901144-Rhodomonas_salina.1